MYFLLGFRNAWFAHLQISFQSVFSGVIYEVLTILIEIEILSLQIECGRMLPYGNYVNVATYMCNGLDVSAR